MDGQLFSILRKICLFLFVGDIFAHAVIGASLVNGIIKGSLSMGAMLVLIIVIYRHERNVKIRKERKERQKEQHIPDRL